MVYFPIRIIIIFVIVTAYTIGDGEGHGITATGIPAQGNIVAVGPSLLGTFVFIPSIGWRAGLDRGGCVVDIGDEDKGKCSHVTHLDVLMESQEEAISFGRQVLPVMFIQFGYNRVSRDKYKRSKE